MAGQAVAWITPTYKYRRPAWKEIHKRCGAAIESSNQNEGVIEFIGGGSIHFWSCEAGEDICRGENYDLVIFDEGGLINGLIDLLDDAVGATLLDTDGDLWLFGTPKGKNDFFALYQRGQSNDPKWEDWISWRFPVFDPEYRNPFIDPKLLAKIKATIPARSWRQEYLAEFVEDGGGAFSHVGKAIRRDGVTDPSSDSNKIAIGVDIAKSHDYTVISVLDADGRQLALERFTAIGFERTEEAIYRMAARYPRAHVWIDSTGMGDPIYERIRLRLGANRVFNTHFTHQSKTDLINNLILEFERKTLCLLDDKVQTDELQSYQIELTPKGKVTYNAPKGMHDDTVIGLALAAWGIRKQKESQRFCFYG